MTEPITISSNNELQSKEHDTTTTPTKKVSVYGWDAVNLTKVRITTDSSGRVAITPVTAAPTVYNVDMTLADTEYSQVLPAWCTSFEIKLRSDTETMKLAFAEDESATNFITIPPNNAYVSDGAILSNQTIYFQSTAASMVAEIIAYA